MRTLLVSISLPPANLEIFGRIPNGAARAADARYRIEGARTPSHFLFPGLGVLEAQEVVGAPCLFENGDYDLYLAAPTGCSLQCDDHPRLVEPVSSFPGTGEQRVTHYRMTLSNDVGYLRLTFRRGGMSIGLVSLEVYPTKVDYKSDYRAIIADLSRITHNLIFTTMSKTNFVGGLSDQTNVLQIEWYRIFEKLAANLLSTVDEISRQPQRRLEDQEVWRPTERARLVVQGRLDRAILRPGNTRGYKHGGKAGSVSGWALVDLPTRDWQTDFDTPANRYVKAMLESIRRRLAGIRRWLNLEADAEGPERASWRQYVNRWRSLIDEFLPQIERRLAYDFLRDAGEYAGSGLPPTMQSHPLYAKLFQISLALKKGIHIEAQEFAYVGSKPIWLLYEYWCYVALLDILHVHLEFVSGDIVQLDPSGSKVGLKKGVESSVVFKHRDSGRKLTVIYNRLYPTPTTWQRPDTAIHIDTGKDLHVFDAKYRSDESREYQQTYGGPGPNLDDINTMHRYRDAIVNTALPGYPRLVRSATVLFPAAGIGYERHRFHESIAEVGVGALPFLPSQKDHVAKRLAQILEF